MPIITTIKSHATLAQTLALGQTFEQGTLNELAEAAADIFTDHKDSFKVERNNVEQRETILEQICRRRAHIQMMCWRLDNRPPVVKADVTSNAQIANDDTRHGIATQARSDIELQESEYGHTRLSSSERRDTNVPNVE